MEQFAKLTEEEIKELKMTEVKATLFVSGELNNFEWTSDFSLEGLKELTSYTVKIYLEDIERVDILRCRLFDGQDNNYSMLLECSRENIEQVHLNNLLTMLIGCLYEDSMIDESELLSGNANPDEFDSKLPLINAIGKVHCMANVILSNKAKVKED